jgi:hypothetical protein
MDSDEIERKYYPWQFYFCNWVMIAVICLAFIVMFFPRRLPKWLFFSAVASVSLISVVGIIACVEYLIGLGDQRTDKDLNWAFLGFLSHCIPVAVILFLILRPNHYFKPTGLDKLTKYTLGCAAILTIMLPYLFKRGSQLKEIYWFVDVIRAIFIGFITFLGSLAILVIYE